MHVAMRSDGDRLENMDQGFKMIRTNASAGIHLSLQHSTFGEVGQSSGSGLPRSWRSELQAAPSMNWWRA